MLNNDNRLTQIKGSNSVNSLCFLDTLYFFSSSSSREKKTEETACGPIDFLSLTVDTICGRAGRVNFPFIVYMKMCTCHISSAKWC